MRFKKRLINLFLAGIIALPYLSTPFEVYADTIKESPNIVYQTIGIGQFFNLNARPPIKYTQRVVSGNIYEGVEYKQSEENFNKLVRSIQTPYVIEPYYLTNTNKQLDYTPTYSGEDKDTLAPITNITTPYVAYNSNDLTKENSFNLESGQWLLNNDVFSRFNSYVKPNKDKLEVSALSKTPWGNLNGVNYIERDDFLVNVIKAAYGPIESRAIMYNTVSMRYAKRVLWVKVYDAKGNLIGYTYSEGPLALQDVSTNNSYETHTISFRNEYVITNEDYHNELRYNSAQDLQSYISTNVYELYILKALEEGLLDPKELFGSSSSGSTGNLYDENGVLIPNSSVVDTDSYVLADNVKSSLERELTNYGKDNTYPPYAPELGYSLKGSSTSKLDLKLLPNSSTDVLGRLYTTNASGLTYTEQGSQQFFKYQPMTTISAYRFIEKVLRTQEKDMTELEAQVITKKYSAKYLDEITDPSDRKTVEYLIALGIIDFEKPEEYRSIYNTLERNYAYTLIYRLANKSARTNFSQVQLTDSESILGSFTNYNIYPNVVSTIDTNKLATVLDNDGNLINKKAVSNNFNTFTTTSEPKEETLDINSNIKLVSVRDSSNGNPVKVLTLSLDDAHKYAYIDAPILMYDGNIQPIKVTKNLWGQPITDTSRTYYMINNRNVIGARQPSATTVIKEYEEKKIYNYIPSSVRNATKEPSGILSISQDNTTGRWYMEVSIISPNLETALSVAKGNFVNLADGLFTETVEDSYVNSQGSKVVSKSSTTFGNTSTGKSLSYKDDILSFFNSSTGKGITGSLLTKASTDNENALMPEESLMASSNGSLYKSDIGNKNVYDLSSAVINKSLLKVEDTNLKLQSKEYLINGEKVRYVNTSNNQMAPVIYVTDTVPVDYSKNGNSVREKMDVEVTYVIEFKADLPNIEEQHILYSQYTKDPNSLYKSWFYTEPEQADLLSQWQYNTGLNKAILSTVGVDTFISGYMYPEVSILVDLEGQKSSNDANIGYIKNQVEVDFYQKVSKNLDNNWIKQFISNDISKALDTYSESAFKPTGTHNINSTIITNKNIPLWANFVFNYRQLNAGEVGNYLNIRLGNPNLKVFSIVEYNNGSTIYGEFIEEQLENTTKLVSTNQEFIMDNTNTLMQRINDSIFSYDRGSLSVNKLTSSVTNSPNKLYNIGGLEYYLIAEDDLNYKFLSKDLYAFKLANGKLVSVTDGLEVSTRFDNLAFTTLDKLKISNINVINSYSTKPFSYSLNREQLDNSRYDLNVQFYDNSYTVVDKTYKKSLPTSEAIVGVPVPLTLSKSNWGIDGTTVVNSNKLLGASYKHINSYNIKSLMVESTTTLADDTVTTDDVEKVDISTSFGTMYKMEDYVYINVPYSGYLKEGDIDLNAIDSDIQEQASQVLTSTGDAYSVHDYLGQSEVAEFSLDLADKYDSTLVKYNGQYVLATGTETTKITEASLIKTVSIKKIIDTSFDILQVKDSTDMMVVANVAGVQQLPPRNQYNSVVNSIVYTDVSTGVDTGSALISENAVPDTSTYFKELKKSLTALKIEAFSHKSFYFLNIVCWVLCGFMVIIRLIKPFQIIYVPVSSIEENTGYDLFKILSVNTTTLEDQCSHIKLGILVAVVYCIPYICLGVIAVFY